MMLDEEIPFTYYAVFDGHGGADCAIFLRDNLHHELKRCFVDPLDGIHGENMQDTHIDERFK